MIKILGSLIVIFAGIGFGFHKAAKEQKRLEQGIAIKRMLYREGISAISKKGGKAVRDTQ